MKIKIFIILLALSFLFWGQLASAHITSPFTCAMQILPEDNNSPETSSGTNLDKFIERHKEMGFKWDRASIKQTRVEKPDGDDWQETDERINKMFQNGIQPSLCIFGKGYRDPSAYKGQMGAEYIEFVKKVVERYDGDGLQDAPNLAGSIKVYEGLNEPVVMLHFDFDESVEVFNRYYNAVKEVCSDCKVASPGYAYWAVKEKNWYREFIQKAVGFDMISVHNFYYPPAEDDPETDFFSDIKRFDDRMKEYGLGNRPWWISEFGYGGNGRTLSDEEYAHNSARMHIAGLARTFDTNLVAITQWPDEGEGRYRYVNWDNSHSLKKTGEAVKTVLSIFQDSSLNGYEIILSGDIGRGFKFMGEGGVNKYAIWTWRHSGNKTLTFPEIDGDVIIKDMYGNSVAPRYSNNGELEIHLTYKPIYIIENGGTSPDCDCSPWQETSCGDGDCPENRMREERECSPSGCLMEERCVIDSSCQSPDCDCFPWEDVSCGGGSCPESQMLQERECSPAGCSSEFQCVNNSSCGNENPGEYGLKENVSEGDKYYIDRNYTLTRLPSRLSGTTLLQTANNDKFSSDPSLFNLQAGEKTTLFLAWDRRFPLPSWAAGFEATEYTLGTTDPKTNFEVYYKEFPGGNIVLGGNECPTNSCSMYFAFLDIGGSLYSKEDITKDGQIDVRDIGALMSYWGMSGSAGRKADVSQDGTVNISDLLEIVESWVL